VEVWQTSNLRRLRLGEKEKERKKKKPRHENIMVINSKMSLSYRDKVKITTELSAPNMTIQYP